MAPLRLLLAIGALFGALANAAQAQSLSPSGETLLRSRTPHAVAPGVYTLQAVHSGLCLVVAGVSLPLARTRVPYLAQGACATSGYDGGFIIGEIEIIADAGGAYRLWPAGAPGCATVARGVVLGPPSIDMQACGTGTDGRNGDDQIFKLSVVRREGAALVVNVLANNGDCLAVRDGDTHEKAEVIRWSCNSHADQQFRLQYIGRPVSTASRELAQAANGFAQSEPPAMISIIETADVNFYGADIDSTPGLSLSQCKARCADDRRCRALSYVRAGVQDPTRPVCWLKNAIPAANADSNVMSAVVRP